MDKLFGVYFMEALAEAKRTAKREENRKRRRKMSAEANAEKAVVCAVCRTYGGTLKKIRQRVYLPEMREGEGK